MKWAGRFMSKSHFTAFKNRPLVCLLLFSILVLVFYGRDIHCPHFLLGQPVSSSLMLESGRQKPETRSELGMLPFALRATNESCDLFTGKWVWDNVTHPLYEEEDCPYINSEITCHANGRPDNSYQFWRWQPDGCDLPSFNASLILESIRGKRMLYVGDSLNRGQFYSMVCLVQSLIPETEKTLERHDSLITFHAKRYNATIEFYWAPFLLESDSDDILIHKETERIVRKGSIDKHGDRWKGADIIIFNTYVWWIRGSNFKVLDGSFEDEQQNINELTSEEAYAMSIESMLQWVKKNMDTTKTRVFFTSMSPFHGINDWGGKEGGNCYNQTEMIMDKTYWNSGCRKSIMQVIKDEFTKSEYPISMLNITQLSSYRKEAHVSIYREGWTSEKIANPIVYADCTHFCLPGLQDTWNELLFSKLLYP